ncbi:MAG: SAM-dependent DNA methyltransferase [Myxococcales bacterium]|nr:SAM-dependent DNA methyltransferase [Myxococcales bacterium]
MYPPPPSERNVMAAKRKTDEGARSAPKRRGRPPKDRSGEAAPSEPARGKRGKSAKAAKSGANLGFEEKLWQAADKLRGSMDASEYKHVVLGLIFLKYVSDAFEQRRAEVLADEFADAEDRDEYEGKNVFWVPPEARWEHLRGRAKSPEIGVLIDAAMDAIERENKTLRGTLPKDYARPAVDKTRLGELLDLLSDVALVDENKDHRSTDLLGRVYEYFLGRFASAEGRGGGEFYTPQSVVRVLVEMLEPYSGRVYDPCCGSGGMFVQSEKFVEEHGGKKSDLSIYGQEWNATTWKLAKMNLAIRGIEANLGDQWGDTFREDKHKGLKADYVLANPPFNISDWGGEHLRDDPRWKYGVPPAGNANFAWLQHIVGKLSPRGVAGVVLANGSMSSQQSGEGEIRKALVEADLVDCMVALPGQLFYSTQIPVCLWFLARDKRGGVGVGGKKLRDRSGETLFIDARKLGTLVDRTHRELGDEEIARIADTYHRWRGEEPDAYEDVAGFCKSAVREELESHQFVLTPGRYVGAEDLDEDDEPIETRTRRLVATLEQYFEAGAQIEKQIRKNLNGLIYGG